MESNNYFKKIQEKILKVFHSTTSDIVKSNFGDIVGIAFPIAGITLNIVNDIATNYNLYKLTYLLNNISTGNDLDKDLEKLLKYVEKSDENAINVANLFRKTINAECPKVCAMYGMILGKHIKENDCFSQNELIICRALVNATELDIINFKLIMENYIKSSSSDNIISIPEDLDNYESITSTRDWCLYNRIFVSNIALKVDDNGSGTFYNDYHITEPAKLLMKYITALPLN